MEREGGVKMNSETLLHCLVWQDQKKKCHSQLTIAAHRTNYIFIADKVHKNPYIARYTLL